MRRTAALLAVVMALAARAACVSAAATGAGGTTSKAAAGPAGGRSENGLRIGVLSVVRSGDFKAPFAGRHLRSLACYCMYHGYHRLIEHDNIPMSDGRPGHYNKHWTLNKHLPFFDWILWVDTDAFVVNSSVSLTHWINHAGNASVIVSDFGPRVNNAVFLIRGRGDPQTSAFMQLWWRLGASYSSFFKDNGPFNLALAMTLAGSDNEKACAGTIGQQKSATMFSRCVTGLMDQAGFRYGLRRSSVWLVSATEASGIRALHYWGTPMADYAPGNMFQPGDFIFHGKDPDRLIELYVGAINQTALLHCNGTWT